MLRNEFPQFETEHAQFTWADMRKELGTYRDVYKYLKARRDELKLELMLSFTREKKNQFIRRLVRDPQNEGNLIPVMLLKGIFTDADLACLFRESIEFNIDNISSEHMCENPHCVSTRSARGIQTVYRLNKKIVYPQFKKFVTEKMLEYKDSETPDSTLKIIDLFRELGYSLRDVDKALYGRGAKDFHESDDDDEYGITYMCEERTDESVSHSV